MNTQPTSSKHKKISLLKNSLVFACLATILASATFITAISSTKTTLAAQQQDQPAKVDHEVTLSNIQFHPNRLKEKKATPSASPTSTNSNTMSISSEPRTATKSSYPQQRSTPVSQQSSPSITMASSHSTAPSMAECQE